MTALRYDDDVKALLLFLFVFSVSALAKPLEIYFIDVEGGQSTLVVSPSGQSLLIDAGYAGFGGRDAERIKTAARHAGVGHIDYLLVTHYHSDHVGGVSNLLQVLKVSNILDYGPSVDAGRKYPDDYAAVVAKIEAAKGTHKVVVPGDKIPVKGLDITVVSAAGKHIERAGIPNPYCAGIQPHPERFRRRDETGENPQAVGVVIELGKFRFGDFGDITWNKELALLCPENKAGKLDLYLATHHGGESSKAIYGLAPRVTILNNGACGPRAPIPPVGRSCATRRVSKICGSSISLLPEARMPTPPIPSSPTRPRISANISRYPPSPRALSRSPITGISLPARIRRDRDAGQVSFAASIEGGTRYVWGRRAVHLHLGEVAVKRPSSQALFDRTRLRNWNHS